MRRVHQLPALVAAAVLAGQAQATVAPELSLAEQARKAQVIVQAKVDKVSTQQRDGLKWNVYQLVVSETLAGSDRQLPQLEDKPAVWVLDGVQGAPEFKKNDEVVLLLYTGLLDSPVVGFNQGVYRIDGRRVTNGGVTDLVALKDAIVKARGAR